MHYLVSVLPRDRFALGEVAGYAIEIERLQAAVSTHGPADHESDIFELITSLGGVPVATSASARRDSERAG